MQEVVQIRNMADKIMEENQIRIFTATNEDQLRC
jgi:hypothetical protein